MDIRAEIQTRVDEIEQIIKRYLPEEEGWQKTIMEAMNYSILAGGKRLRPMLMSETYRLFGGKSKVIEPFMAAMEMIHTYWTMTSTAEGKRQHTRSMARRWGFLRAMHC